MTDPEDTQSEAPATQPAESTAPSGLGARLRAMPVWEKVFVGLALTGFVVGGVLTLTSSGDPSAATGGDPGSATGLRTALIEGQPTPTGGGTQAAIDEPASKGFFRLGFSFLAGFSIGMFLRATLKLAAIAFGFWLVMTFVLSYIGIVTVDWDAMDGLWRKFADNVEAEWGSFQSFMLGSLPATGLAATGLVIGLKRH